MKTSTPRTTNKGTETAPWTLGRAQTPFGACLLGWNPAGICTLEFLNEHQQSVSTAELAAALAQKRGWRPPLDDAPAQAQTLCNQIFQSSGPAPNITLALQGTPFQLNVWNALRSIPMGSTLSYGALAAQIGQPNAARAVGTALAANTVAYLVPCHRVVQQSGATGQFRWGIDRKIKMLAWEAHQLAAISANR